MFSLFLVWQAKFTLKQGHPAPNPTPKSPPPAPTHKPRPHPYLPPPTQRWRASAPREEKNEISFLGKSAELKHG